MVHDTVLTVFVIVAAVAICLQAGVMLGLYLALRNVPRQIEDIRRDIKQRIDPVTQSVTEILASSREPVGSITANLAEISRILRERTSQVDSLLADLADKSRVQIIRVDRMVSDLTEKIEATADVVQRKVLAPILEVSAVIKGVRSGLEFLFSRRRRTPNVSEATQDEELFI